VTRVIWSSTAYTREDLTAEGRNPYRRKNLTAENAEIAERNAEKIQCK
jgi:hypothetical protein